MPDDLVLRNAVAAAVMAPSSHNTQPWRFKLADGSLELYADPRRQLLVIDRDYRQLVQSCGCALMNARVAIRARGYEDYVSVLVRAIGRRGTNRRSFLARPIGEAFTDLLTALARNERDPLVARERCE